ncbi:MAG: tetratricopeptide repeat protein [Candidatus Thorarchaeota archaeon]|jgi:tetratricopeptide (TPR) repeat protein
MKPIGTITKFYPFISVESVKVVESLVEEADHYHDFASKLGDAVCSVEASTELVYLAALHIWHIRDSLAMKIIAKIYGTDSVVQFFMNLGLSISGNENWKDDVQVALADALKQDLPDWIAFQLHLYYAYSIIEGHPANEVSEALEPAKELLLRDPQLSSFQAWIHFIDAQIRLTEVDMLNAVLSHTKALNLVGHTVVEKSPSEALEYLDESLNISESLNIPRSIGNTTYFMGYACSVLGEYDLALKFFFRAAEIAESIQAPMYHILLNIGRVYNILGEGRKAVEWLQDANDHLGSEPSHFLHLHMAEALVLNRKLDEADRILNQAHKMVLESGRPTAIAWYEYARGVYLLELGDSQSGIDLLTSAFKYFEGFEYGNANSQILTALTKAEIQYIPESISDVGGEVSGPWMTKLEAHARRRNFPGVMIQAALLKAEYLEQQGRYVLAREILESALHITDSLSVKTLHTRVRNRLRELPA